MDTRKVNIKAFLPYFYSLLKRVDYLKQGSVSPSLWVWPSVFMSIVLLERSCAHSIMQCLRLLLSCNSRVKQLQQSLYKQRNIFTIWSFKKKFDNHWFKAKIIAGYYGLIAHIKINIQQKQHRNGREDLVIYYCMQSKYLQGKHVFHCFYNLLFTTHWTTAMKTLFFSFSNLITNV